MVQVIVEADQVIFTVEGWDRLWGLRTLLTIPAAHIRSVRRGADVEMGLFDGLKLAGTSVPGLFRAGTFLQHGDLVFWDVKNRENAIVVGLEHEYYRQLIIEVADPETSVRLIEAATSARPR